MGRDRLRPRGIVVLAIASACATLASMACGFDGPGAAPPETVSPAERGASSSGGGDGSSSGSDGGPGAADGMTAPDSIELPKPLVLTWADAPANVDLETEGSLAWIHFGTQTNDEDSFNQKATAPGVLPRFTVTGSNDVRTYEDNFTLFSWTNGAGMATQSGTRNGVYSKTGFPKFHLDRVVGPEPQRWIVYAGVYKCKALLTVSLGSAPTDPKATAVLDSTQKGYGRYVIEHRAPAAGTPLTVTWELTHAYDPSNSNVTLAASTLAAIP